MEARNLAAAGATALGTLTSCDRDLVTCKESEPSSTPSAWQVSGYSNLTGRRAAGIGTGLSFYEKMPVPVYGNIRFQTGGKHKNRVPTVKGKRPTVKTISTGGKNRSPLSPIIKEYL